MLSKEVVVNDDEQNARANKIHMTLLLLINIGVFY